MKTLRLKDCNGAHFEVSLDQIVGFKPVVIPGHEGESFVRVVAEVGVLPGDVANAMAFLSVALDAEKAEAQRIVRPTLDLARFTNREGGQ